MYSAVDIGERCDRYGPRRAPWSALEPLRPCVPSIADSGACRSVIPIHADHGFRHAAGPRRACRGRCRRDWTTRVGPDTAAFVERLLEREKTDREQRRYQRLKGHAKLHLDATIEDLNFKAPRGLDRSLVLRLASGQWIRDGQTVLVAGATGSGKSYLACAFGHQACRLGISTRYYRVSRLLDELTLARGDGSYPKLIQRLARTWLLILDDWGLASLSGQGRHDLLDDRYARRGTLLASQVPVEHWHDVVGDPTFGDALFNPQPRPPAPLWTSAPPR